MVDEALLADSDVRTGWSRVASLFPGGSVHATEHAAVCVTGSGIAWFNPWFPTGTDVPATVLDDVAEVYGAHGVVGCGWLRVGTNAAVLAEAGRRGLAVEPGPPSMAMDLAAVPLPPPPPGLDVVRVRDEKTLREALSLLQPVFEVGDAEAGMLANERWLSEEELVLLLAYRDGAPVSSATAHVRDGVVGVYSVATPDALRGQGLGTAMTWEAVRVGVDRGCTHAVLQSSEIGYAVYERMGFRRVGSYVMVTVPGGSPAG